MTLLKFFTTAARAGRFRVLARFFSVKLLFSAWLFITLFAILSYKTLTVLVINTMEIAIQTSGWVGTILIVLAYFLVSRQFLAAKSRVYQLMNLFGAIGVGVNVFNQEAWPALALQIIWAIIAIISLIRPE